MPRITDQHKNLATELLAVLNQFSHLPDHKKDDVFSFLNREGTYSEDFGPNISPSHISRWRTHLANIEAGKSEDLNKFIRPGQSFADSALVMVISDLAVEVDTYTGNTNHLQKLDKLIQSPPNPPDKGILALISGSSLDQARMALTRLATAAEETQFLQEIQERQARFQKQKQWKVFFEYIADHPKHAASLQEYKTAAFHLRDGVEFLQTYLNSLSPHQQEIFLAQVGLSQSDIAELARHLIADHPKPDPSLCKKLAQVPLALSMAGFFESKDEKTQLKAQQVNQFEGQVNQAIARLETALELKDNYSGSILTLVGKKPKLAILVFGSSLSGRSASKKEREATIIQNREFIDPSGKNPDTLYWAALMRSLEYAPPAEISEHFKMRQIIYTGLKDHLAIIRRNLRSKQDQAPFNEFEENQRQRLLRDLNILAVALNEAIAGREGLLLNNLQYLHDLAQFARHNYMRSHRFLGTGDSKNISGREAFLYLQQNPVTVADGELSRRAQKTPRKERITIWQSIEAHLKTIDLDSTLNQISSENEKTAIKERWALIQKYLRNASRANENEILSSAASSTMDIHYIYRLLESSAYFDEANKQKDQVFLTHLLEIPGLERIKSSPKVSIASHAWDEIAAIFHHMSTLKIDNTYRQNTAEARQTLLKALHRELESHFPEWPDQNQLAQIEALYARRESPYFDETIIQQVRHNIHVASTGREYPLMTQPQNLVQAGALFDHFGGVSPQLQEAIEQMLTSSREHFPKTSASVMKVNIIKPDANTELTWKPIHSDTEANQLWLSTQLSFYTQVHGVYVFEIYYSPILNQIIVDAQVSQYSDIAIALETDQQAEHKSIHRPAVIINGKALPASYQAHYSKLQFRAGFTPDEDTNTLQVYLQNFAGARLVPAGKIQEVLLPSREEAQTIYQNFYSAAVSKKLVTSEAHAKVQGEALTAIRGFGEAAAGIGRSMLKAASESGEPGHHEALVSIEILRALTKQVSPGEVRNYDKSFDLQIFTGLYNQLIKQLSNLEGGTTPKKELKVSLKLLAYLYLESARHPSDGIRPPTEKELRQNSVNLSRAQVESLITDLELLQKIGLGYKDTKKLKASLKKLKIFLEGSESPESTIRIPLAAAAHAYRLQAENFIEVNAAQARTTQKAIAHYLNQFSIEPERTRQDYINLQKTLDEKLATNPQYVTLLNEEAELAVFALDSVTPLIYGPEYDQRIKVNKNIKAKLNRKSYEWGKTQERHQTIIDEKLFKKEIKRVERILKDKGSEGTLEAFKREFAEQMTIQGLHAAIFALDEPHIHSLGLEAQSFVYHVRINPDESKIPLKIYYTTHRGPKQELARLRSELNAIGQKQFSSDLEIIYQQEGMQQIELYILATYKLLLRKMGLSEEDLITYQVEKPEIFQGEGFEVYLCEYLSSGEMPQNFWTQAQKSFGPALSSSSSHTMLLKSLEKSLEAAHQSRAKNLDWVRSQAEAFHPQAVTRYHQNRLARSQAKSIRPQKQKKSPAKAKLP